MSDDRFDKLLDMTQELHDLGMQAIKERDALKQRVQELEAERRWIPCDKQMPADGQEVFVWINKRDIRFVKFDQQFSERRMWLRYTHWMPMERMLPQPPEASDSRSNSG